MFSREKQAMAVTIEAQAQTVKAQADVIKALAERLDVAERELRGSRTEVMRLEGRIASLEGYFSDLGLQAPSNGGDAFWWHQAIKMIDIKVDPDRVKDDLTFANQTQKDYVALLARKIVKNSAPATQH